MSIAHGLRYTRITSSHIITVYYSVANFTVFETVRVSLPLICIRHIGTWSRPWLAQLFLFLESYCVGITYVETLTACLESARVYVARRASSTYSRAGAFEHGQPFFSNFQPGVPKTKSTWWHGFSEWTSACIHQLWKGSGQGYTFTIAHYCFLNQVCRSARLRRVK